VPAARRRGGGRRHHQIAFFSCEQGTDALSEPLQFDVAPADCKDIAMLHSVRFDTDTIPAQFPRPLNVVLALQYTGPLESGDKASSWLPGRVT